MISWIITIAVVCIITSVIFCKPYLGIAFVILSIPFEGLVDSGSISIYPLEAILAIFGLICIYKLIVGKENYFRNTRLMCCCIPFVLCIMLSAMKSIELSLTAKEIVRWLELFLIYYLTINFINDEKKMRIILYSMFLAVAMVSVFGAINIISFFKTNLPVGERDFFFFGNANPFASYLNLIIPVILGMMMVSALLWERIVLGALAFLSIIVWVLTFSKSSYLSFLLSIALVLFLAKSKKRVLLVLATFFAIFAITLLFSDIREALMDRVGLQTLLISLGFRAECYSAGFNMVRDGLVFGIGIGSYPFYIMKFSTNSYITQHHLHSLYLQIFVETGFLGISAFVFWLVCIIKYLVNSLKPLEDFRHYWLFVGLMGGVIAYLFSNFTDVLVVHGIHLQWGIMLGLAVVLIQFREKEKCPEMV